MPLLVALAVIDYLSHDGYNQLGDLTPAGGLINGNPYNRWNYSVPPWSAVRCVRGRHICVQWT